MCQWVSHNRHRVVHIGTDVLNVLDPTGSATIPQSHLNVVLVESCLLLKPQQLLFVDIAAYISITKSLRRRNNLRF